MANAAQPERPSRGLARFGAFELDTASGELRRRGHLVSLQDQQAVVLKYLVERAGLVVTRDELRAQIWPEGTYVEFEYGLYNTINRLRRALGDSASNPNFIETVPKQGYRFIAALDYVRDDEGTVSAPVVATNGVEARPEPALESVIPTGALPSWSIRWRAAGFTLLGAILGAVLGVAFWHSYAKAPTGDQVYRYAIPVPDVAGINSLAISPAGDQIVFEGANRLLWRRYLDRTDPRPIRGSEGGTAPFFSPNGQSVGFFAGNILKIAEGERSRQLAVLPPDYRTSDATWSEDGFVYFDTRQGDVEGIWRVPAGGGTKELIVRSTYSGRGAGLPLVNQVVTRPTHLLIYSVDIGPVRRSLHVRDLTTGLDKTIAERAIGGHLLPHGELTYYSRGSLFATPFDWRNVQLKGTPAELVKDVEIFSWQSARAAISDTGTLVYVARGEPQLRVLQWVDPSGQVTTLPLPADRYEQAEVSPHGDLLAIVRTEALDRASLSTYDLRTGAWRHIEDSDVPRLRAQWNPDETALLVSSARQNEDFANLYRVPLADPANPQRLTQEPDYGQFPLSWSAKANAILFIEGVHPQTNSDLMVLPLGGNRSAKKLVATAGWDRSASFSPDGRRFVYESDVEGQPEIFLQGYDAEKAAALGPALKISRDGGSDPLWDPDGRSIYYSDSSKQLVEVSLVEHGSSVYRRIAGVSMEGRKDYWTRTCSIAPDGRLLIIHSLAGRAMPPEIQVVVNWAAEVKRLSPGS
jgi:DNA-binding winged helix-turn-helix (wHTH) protein/Tol biopolymer transport system component